MRLSRQNWIELFCFPTTCIARSVEWTSVACEGRSADAPIAPPSYGPGFQEKKIVLTEHVKAEQRTEILNFALKQ